MVISCIGDSLTEGDYGVFGKRGIANVHKENYPYFLALLTGAEVHNFGKCGFTSTDYRKYYEKGNVDVKGSDIVIIMLGTNGGLDIETDTDGNRDYDILISNIKADAPNARIILCTPPHVTKNRNYSNYGCAEKVEKAVNFVRKYAHKHNYDIIDIASCTDFRDDTESIMQPNDGLHFGTVGYKKMAEFIAKGL